MKVLLTFAILLTSSFALFSQVQDTIYLDMGGEDNMSTDGWNNLYLQRTGYIEDMIDVSGMNTGISVDVSDDFNGVNKNGLDADASLEIPGSASHDSFFGNTSDWSGATEPTGGITFSNLDVSTTYSFRIFASREASDNRETKYTVTGATTEVAAINAASNTSNEAIINDMYPAEDGTITIIASPGENNNNSYGFFYMGVVKIFFLNSYVPPTPELKLTYPNGGELFEEGKEKIIEWESTSVSLVDIEFSSDGGTGWETIASSVSASNLAYTWTVPSAISENCLIRITDVSNTALCDTSDAVFTIIPDDGLDFSIVVLGSSTAAGQGPTTVDSAWVWMYAEYLNQTSANYEVTNLAVGGYTTYNILPTGYQIPSGIGKTVDPAHNITKALSLFPDAIIINLPSNDASNGFPVVDQLTNYDTIAKLAASHDVPLWVCTPQPKNFDSSKDQIQLDMVDSTFSIFGNKAIDFWNGLVETDGTYDVIDIYDSGDGTHLNNRAHKLLLSRVIDADLPLYIESSHATNYFTIPEDNITIDYEASSTGRITILSDLDWTVSDDADWLDLSAESGSGEAEIVVTANSENAEVTPRVATLTFSPSGLSDVLVTVTQNAIELYTLTVVNGTGSGDYPEGEIVDIDAVPEGAYDEFFAWTGDTDYIGDMTSSRTHVIMPASDISITATFITSSKLHDAAMSDNVFIYPNPVSELLNIRFREQFEGSIQIYTLTGQLVLNRDIDAELETLDVGMLESGLYMIEISDRSGKRIYHGKVVKY